MRDYSKLLSLVVFTTLGTFLWSCNDDEDTTPNTQTCNLKTATIGEGTDTEVFNFTYNAQNQITSLSGAGISGNLVYQNNRVVLNVPEVDIADTMLLQGGRWSSAFSTSESNDNDSTVIYSRTIITPTFTGNLVTQIKTLSIEETRVNGLVEAISKDSTITTLTYNNKGNVVRIATQGSDSFELTYSDSTANIKVNNYFNGNYFSEFFGEAALLPLLTGDFKLCNNPPSTIFNSQSPTEKDYFRNIKADANGNLTEVSLYEGTSATPYDTFKFTYDCK